MPGSVQGLGHSTWSKKRGGKGWVSLKEVGLTSWEQWVVTAVPSFPSSQECPAWWLLSSMSLDAWEWEGEDRGSVGPRASMGTSHLSGSECDVEECLKAGAGAQESESDHQCSSIGSSGPASTFNSDPPHVVPCEFTISLAFPVNVGKC